MRQAAAADFEATLRAGRGASATRASSCSTCTATSRRRCAGWLEELGLVACGRHAPLETIETELARAGRGGGGARLAAPRGELGRSRRARHATLARLAVAATAVAERGLELGYHNHDAEVEQGFLERLPDGVFLELDAGWAWYAGVDPVALLGRGPLVHIKDFRVRGEHSYCPVGDGAVGYERIVPAAARAGAEWLIVEQDEPEGSELEAARRSLAAVITMLGEVA